MDILSGHFQEEDVARLTRELSWTRPLIPYPNWQFDMGWSNSGLAYRLRKMLWQENSRLYPGHRFPLAWYDGLQVQTYWGSDESKQLYVGGCIEPNEFYFLSSFLCPGMVFVDVGANNGLYTIFAANRLGPLGTVLAFEPSEREFERLQTNIALNRLENIKPYSLALSNFLGTAQLKVAQAEHAGHNTLGDFAYDTRLLQTQTVPVTTLDQVARDRSLHRLDVLKIDAEGAEFAILEGAQEILEDFDPLILFEAFPAALKTQGSSLQEIEDLLHSLDYELYILDAASPVPLPSGMAEGNVIAIPNDVTFPVKPQLQIVESSSRQ